MIKLVLLLEYIKTDIYINYKYLILLLILFMASIYLKRNKNYFINTKIKLKSSIS